MLVNSPSKVECIISKLAIIIRAEMKSISSDAHNSVLWDSREAVMQFHWEAIRLELMQKIPTLMKLLLEVVGKACTSHLYSVFWPQ